MFIRMDLALNATRCDEDLRDFLKISRQAFVGKPLGELLPGLCEQTLEQISAAAHADMPLVLSIPHINTSNEPMTLELQLCPVPDADEFVCLVYPQPKVQEDSNPKKGAFLNQWSMRAQVWSITLFMLFSLLAVSGIGLQALDTQSPKHEHQNSLTLLPLDPLALVTPLLQQKSAWQDVFHMAALGERLDGAVFEQATQALERQGHRLARQLKHHPNLIAPWQDIQDAIEKNTAHYRDSIQQLQSNDVNKKALFLGLKDQHQSVTEALEQLHQRTQSQQQQTPSNTTEAPSTGIQQARNRYLMAIFVATVTFLGFAFYLGHFIQKTFRALKTNFSYLTNFVEGTQFDVQRKDEVGDLNTSLQAMSILIAYRQQQDRDVLRTHTRIEKALESVSASIALVDNRGRIQYLNPAAANILAERYRANGEVKPAKPDEEIIGKRLTFWLDDPQANQTLLDTSDDKESELHLWGRILSAKSLPVLDNNNERLGTVIEFRDRTHEIAVETQIKTIVDSASEGDLSGRIPEDKENAFTDALSTTINHVLDIVSNVVGEIDSVMSHVSRGRLNQRIEGEYQGIFKTVQNNINSTIKRLSDVVEQVSHSSGQIGTAIGEINEKSELIETATHDTSIKLQSASGTIADLHNSAQENLERSKQADAVAKEATDVATLGGETVAQAIESMQEVNSRANKIVQIISVINEIAFQTNLLALNASVEAARAGDHGSGFAVVAQEVRGLAARSARASGEIESLINDSVQVINQSSEAINESGSTLNEIVQRVQTLSEFVSMVKDNGDEQNQVLAELDILAKDIEAVMQSCENRVQDATRSAQHVTELTNNMDKELKFFSLG